MKTQCGAKRRENLIISRRRYQIGTKIGSNSFTGFEYQPNARLVWTPNEKNAVWGAASRAVRVPTRLEDNAAVPGIPNINPNLDSEELISFELGLRHIFNKDLFVDVAAFANRYDNLIAQNFAADRCICQRCSDSGDSGPKGQLGFEPGGAENLSEVAFADGGAAFRPFCDFGSNGSTDSSDVSFEISDARFASI